MQKYTTFDHTADIGLEIFGRTKKELFANAAIAIKDMTVGGQELNVKKLSFRKLTVDGTDVADLLVNFLREVLYLFNGEAFIIRQCEILSCSNKKVTANLKLAPFNPKKHVVLMEFKAVTYHGLSVERRKSGWKARVIIDV